MDEIPRPASQENLLSIFCSARASFEAREKAFASWQVDLDRPLEQDEALRFFRGCLAGQDAPVLGAASVLTDQVFHFQPSWTPCVLRLMANEAEDRLLSRYIYDVRYGPQAYSSEEFFLGTTEEILEHLQKTIQVADPAYLIKDVCKDIAEMGARFQLPLTRGLTPKEKRLWGLLPPIFSTMRERASDLSLRSAFHTLIKRAQKKRGFRSWLEDRHAALHWATFLAQGGRDGQPLARASDEDVLKSLARDGGEWKGIRDKAGALHAQLKSKNQINREDFGLKPIGYDRRPLPNGSFSSWAPLENNR